LKTTVDIHAGQKYQLQSQPLRYTNISDLKHKHTNGRDEYHRVKLALQLIVVDMEHAGNNKALTTRTVQSLTELPVVQSIVTYVLNRLFNRIKGQGAVPPNQTIMGISLHAIASMMSCCPRFGIRLCTTRPGD
jgi:hypothetical protein